MSKQGLVRGSSIMVTAIGIAKFLGIISIVPINQLLGNVGQGFYSTAYNLYTILMVLAQGGLPTALSKLISERASGGNYLEIEQLYRFTLKLVSFFAVIGALLVWFGAPYYATLVALHATKQDIAEMTISVRALAPAILIVPFESALRGYLQGFQEVRGPALSQVSEQLFRVLVAVLGTLFIVKMGMGVAKGAAAATFGAFVGAIAGVFILWQAIVPLRKKNRPQFTSKSQTTSNGTIRRMLYAVALPVCLGSLVVPISSNVDSLTVVNFLTHFAGQTFNQAQASFGILSRQAQNLVQLPLAFTIAVGFSVMPAISAAKSQNDQTDVQLNIITPIRMMFIVTFPSAAVFFALARPIEFMFSNSYDGANIIATISFMCIFSSMELMSTYILQGLGNFYQAVRNMFLGVALKAILNILLIILLKSVIGAAIATILGYMLSSTLNVLAVRKCSGVQFSVPRLALPFLLASLPLLIELLLVNNILSYLGASLPHNLAWAWNILQLLISCLIGSVLYVFIAIRLRLLRPKQLHSLPIVGHWLWHVTERIAG